MIIQNLLDIMAKLRDPENGCPWDLEQNFASIAPYTIEEAYEVSDAIDRNALDELADELGDLLLQVVYHARMAEEMGAFDFADVLARICNKMIRRHPHVFGEDSVANAREQTEAWEALKAQEKGSLGNDRVLGGIPVAMPALTRAAKLGRRASRVGFDWPDRAPVRAKIDEELSELDQALAGDDRDAWAAEIGDLLFAITNLCRHLDLDPESCLRGTNGRFERRFDHVEAGVRAAGSGWQSFDLKALDELWESAKVAERK